MSEMTGCQMLYWRERLPADEEPSGPMLILVNYDFRSEPRPQLEARGT